MNLSFMTFSLMRDRMAGKIDADTLVRLAKENGMDRIDVIIFEFMLYGDELKTAMDKYGVKLGCPIGNISYFTDTEEEIRKAGEEALRFAASFGCQQLMIVPGRYDDAEKEILRTMTREEILKKAVAGYAMTVEQAKAYGITVGFENTPHDLKPLASAEDCEYLLQQVPGLGLIFDTGNFRVADVNCDEVAIYEQLKEYIIRVHLKDVVVGPFENGERCVNGDYIRCVSSGSGIIPLKEIIHRLQRDGYEGELAVEYAAPEELHGEEHLPMVKVYADYLNGCLAGEPLQTKYTCIEGIDNPVSRMFFGTAILPMLMGKDVYYLLDAAMTYGINSFDTARGYGGAEASLGRWIAARNNRNQIVILSKCGNCAPDGSVCVNRQVIETELAESLRTLGTDYIDIYLLHRDDPKTPVSEFIETLNEAQRAGKIRIFGCSNWTHERIEEANAYAAAHGLNGFAASSPYFGLAVQVADPWGGDCVAITGEENEQARAWYRSNQMPVLAYSSMARGLFAGKIRSDQEDKAAEILDPPGVKGYVSNENFIRLKRCEELAEKKGCTVAQLAMGWMFTQGMNLFALASTTRVSRIADNLKALYVDITKEEADYLNLAR